MTENVRDPITTADAWIGPDIQNDDGWIMYLDDAANAEIDAALNHAKTAGVRIPFSADLFPLPNFSAQIDQVVERTSNGLGVVMVRGLERERYSNADCESIYWGLGAHMGNPVSQNTRGHPLGYVTDRTGHSRQSGHPRLPDPQSARFPLRSAPLRYSGVVLSANGEVGRRKFSGQRDITRQCRSRRAARLD